MNMGIIAASRLRATGISPFIIEVKTDNTGVSNNNQFQITGAEGDYDVVAKQNDTQVATFNDLSGQQTITLPSSGIYDLEVFPKASNGFSRIRFAGSGDILKMLDIKQWGDVAWSSFESAFWGCSNMLTTATDVPNLSSVTNMSYMFLGASSANPETSNWDVSSVTSMGYMFLYSNLSVENLASIYENWSQLNLQQNVEFGAGNTKYNASGQAGRDILVNTYNWIIEDGGLLETPFIIEIDSTESGVSNNNQFQFTGALGDYDVIAKQNGTQVATFNDLSGAETITLPSSGVYDLEVFPKASNGFDRIRFDDGGDKDKMLDIKQWGTIVWSTFNSAFNNCDNMLVTATDIPNLSQVNDLGSMFRDATLANPDTLNWNVSSVIDMGIMFYNAASANPDTSNWDVSNVTDMSFMFYNTPSASPDTSNWDVSSVTTMRGMFYNATSANPNTSNWNVSNVTDMSFMFRDATSANPDTTNWDVSNVADMRDMFRSTSSVNPDTTNWDVSSVTNMNSMFRSATLANPDVSNWDVSNVTNMRYMFFSALSANPDVSNWDVSNVTNMRYMFRQASSANPDTSNWDVSSVTDMNAMFLNSNLSVENLTACYENWSQLSLQNNVSFGAGTTKYNPSGQAGRDILVNTYNWIITDGGQV